ncbi:MAG: EAL domain-containing protein [Deltaproteobacteria bacterium]|nr:EAL domain-containing protein [Deltaproteobacteria bacterium]
MASAKWGSFGSSLKLDRGSFLAYFMGGIVPLIALGAVADRYALSPFAEAAKDDFAIGLIVLVGSICLLSLGSFLMLRRLVQQTIRQSHLLAYYDSLTGLPNRKLFTDRLEQSLHQARRSDRLVAMCFLDLDGFKLVNDTLGHSAGDRMLREVSERVMNCTRLSDSIARASSEESSVAVSRLGGDEFTFVLNGIARSDDAGIVADRVLNAIRKPFVLEGREVTASASIGIAVFPHDGEDAETLLRNADRAMYWAKGRGRNNYQFYAESMNTAAKRKIELEGRLRRALDDDDLTLHYQPMRNAEGTTVTSAEALLRWEDPDLGPISPAEFIPVAEETGLIVRVGEWVLRTACAQAQAWQEAGYRPIRMSVNLSGRQIRRTTLVESVDRVLRESNLSPAHLELEITESTIMQDDDVTLEAFRELDEMGVGLALDDFGTGYSSLSYLRRFPISRVKIDRSFVNGVPDNKDDTILVAAVIAMARSLGLAVVAEGVETREQADFLRDSGCDELQGYLFSPAVPAEDFARFLEKEKPGHEPDPTGTP